MDRQRKEFELRIQELNERNREIVENINEIEGQMQQWLKEWQTATLPLKLPDSSKVDEVMEYVEALDDIFKKVDDSKAHQQRIDAWIEIKKFSRKQFMAQHLA